VTARSKPVVAAGPLGVAAATLPAPGFAKPPLVCGDAAVAGGGTVGDADPGLVKPPLDGELEEGENVTLPHSDPLLWLDMKRPEALGTNPIPMSRRAAAAIRERCSSLTMVPFRTRRTHRAPPAR
jgi:hypothetical protein